MTIAAALGGWAAALLAVGLAGLSCRALGVRSEAVARACHELRGPLTAVRLGLLLSVRTGELSPASLRAIDTELGRAARALEDLGRAPRMAGGRRRGASALGELAPVSLGRLLVEAVDGARGRAAAAGANVSGDWSGPDEVVWGDRLRLAQALGNLVANAIEHGGGTVRVRGATRHGRARIEVVDDGPGLTATVEALARRPRAGRGRRGRGLAIALEVARAHGGTVVAAPVGRGGRIALELPVSPSRRRRHQRRQ